MGFLKQEVPVIDFAEWSKGTRSEKIRPMARHWAEVGFGTPVALHLFYVVKIGLYVAVAALFTIGHSQTDPIVFQKVVLFTMLFEIVGLGCGFGPLNNRFYPPMGSALYWLRPNTIRLPPWPNRVPFTKGDNRDPVDVLLYGALLVTLTVALVCGPVGTGLLPAWQSWAVLVLLALAGLRDKTLFLAARGEVRSTRLWCWHFCSAATTPSSPRSWPASPSGWARPPPS